MQATCSVCLETAEVEKIESKYPVNNLPPGWTTIMLDTQPVINKVLCRYHTHAVLVVLRVYGA